MEILFSLSNELLLHILSYLNPLQIELLALTFNHAILQLCLPLLQQRIAAARNKRRMFHLFDVVSPYNGVVDTSYDTLALANVHGPFSHNPSPSEHLEYLNLKGDLHWLVPLDDFTARISNHQRSCITQQKVDNFMSTASRLGLTVPTGFESLMRDQSLQERIPSESANLFILDRLGKINMPILLSAKKPGKELAQHADEYGQGYTVGFYTDFHGYAYWNLYLDTCGDHCVLVTRWHLPDDNEDDDLEDNTCSNATVPLTALESELGVVSLSSEQTVDVKIDGTNFEEWLATLYFSEWTWLLTDPLLAPVEDSTQDNRGVEVPKEIEEYLVNVYTEKGRAKQRYI